MNRQLLVLIVSTLILVPYAVKAEEPTPKKAAQPKSNQVFVKIMMPTDPADREKDRPVVESWIAEDLKKRGQAKFTAVTEWVPLDLSPFEATDVWDGTLGKQYMCPVGADIPDRAEGRIIARRSLFQPWFSSLFWAGEGGGAIAFSALVFKPVLGRGRWGCDLPGALVGSDGGREIWVPDPRYPWDENPLPPWIRGKNGGLGDRAIWDQENKVWKWYEWDEERRKWVPKKKPGKWVPLK